MSTPSPPAPPPASPRSAARPTATFVPYFWEAYNEIVEPRRFDHYLIRRWLPDLGPTGFAIVKALRDRCYHNPATGVLRDSCEIDLDDLGDAIGVSKATIVREIRKNTALAQFIDKVRQYRIVDGKPRKDSNAYRVCMDDPIHPDDMQAYDDLRALREAERDAPRGKTVIKGENGEITYKDQNEPYSKSGQKPGKSYKDQNEPNRTSYTAQNEPSDTTYLSAQSDSSEPTVLSAQSDSSKVDLPSGSLLTSSLTPAASGPPIYAPQGAPDPDSLTIAWSLALAAVEPTLTRPTFGLHVTRLQPRDLIDLPDGSAELVVEAPSAFSREWVQARAIPEAIAESLTDSLGRPVTVRLTQIGGLSSPAPDEAASAALEAHNAR